MAWAKTFFSRTLEWDVLFEMSKCLWFVFGGYFMLKWIHYHVSHPVSVMQLQQQKSTVKYISLWSCCCSFSEEKCHLKGDLDLEIDLKYLVSVSTWPVQEISPWKKNKLKNNLPEHFILQTCLISVAYWLIFIFRTCVFLASFHFIDKQ